MGGTKGGGCISCSFMRQQYVRNTVYIGILQKANTPLTLKVGQASSPDIIMTDGGVCPTNRGESKSPLLVGTSSRAQSNDKGVGNEFAYKGKVIGFCGVKLNLIYYPQEGAQMKISWKYITLLVTFLVSFVSVHTISNTVYACGGGGSSPDGITLKL